MSRMSSSDDNTHHAPPAPPPFEDQVVARVRAWLARNMPRLEEIDDATLTITIRDTGHRSSHVDGYILATASFLEGCDAEGIMGRVESGAREVAP